MVRSVTTESIIEEFRERLMQPPRFTPDQLRIKDEYLRDLDPIRRACHERRLAGASYRQIARELKLDHDVVCKAISSILVDLRMLLYPHQPGPEPESHPVGSEQPLKDCVGMDHAA